MPAAKNNPPSADSKQRCQYQSCASRWSPSPKMLARQATSTSQQDREEAQYRKNAAQPKNLLTHPNSLPQSISKRFDLKTSRLTIAMCSLFFALTAVSAQPPPSDATPTANPVFQKSCAKCHGKTAEGHYFGGPSLISEKTSATSADVLRTIMTNGRGRMPNHSPRARP